MFNTETSYAIPLLTTVPADTANFADCACISGLHPIVMCSVQPITVQYAYYIQISLTNSTRIHIAIQMFMCVNIYYIVYSIPFKPALTSSGLAMVPLYNLHSE